jgi:hypothetical protein
VESYKFCSTGKIYVLYKQYFKSFYLQGHGKMYFLRYFYKEETRGRRRQLRTKDWSLLGAVVFVRRGGYFSHVWQLFMSHCSVVHLNCLVIQADGLLGGCCPHWWDTVIYLYTGLYNGVWLFNKVFVIR